MAASGTFDRRDRATTWSSAAAPTLPDAPRELPVACEVAIVGAGITGLTAALHLRETGRSVLVLDQKTAGAGTTGHSSAHLTTLLDSGLRETETVFSVEANRTVTRAMGAAIQQIEHWTAQHHIACDFERVDGYMFSENAEDDAAVREEAAAAARAGVSVRLPSETPLPFPVRLAFRVPDQAQFDPLAYVHGLARAFIEAGGIIAPSTRVTDFREGRPCELTTDRGVVRADDIILATHTPLGRSLVHTEIEPQRSHLIAAETGMEPPRALFWDADSPYHYFRRIDRPGHRPLLLLGGADHKTGQPPASADPYSVLESWLQERFPIERVIARWSAQYYVPVDGFPFVGRPPTGSHVLVATGFNGDGLTLGTAAGSVLADLIIGRESELAALWSPTRAKGRALGRFVSLNLDTARHLAPTGGQEDPPPGEGTIQRRGAGAVAVYRTEAGELITLSARCPHLRCVVQWNPVEATWDCPCHGGRFTPEGVRIEGPPRADLERLESEVAEPSQTPRDS